MSRLPDLEAWAIFATVAEQRSFSGAAEALGLSKATVSKAVTRLEGQLGQSLFHRTSRRIALTETGKGLAVRAQHMLGEATAAEEAARDAAAAPTGLIRMTAPMSFGLRMLGPVLADFLGSHPGIEIDLTLSDARIDIVTAGLDIALRIATLPDSSLRARRLCGIAVRCVAAPAYLERHGSPAHPADLAARACLVYSNATTWHFAGRGGEQASVRPRGQLRADNGDALIPALHAGLGIALLPDFFVDEDIAKGALQVILAGWTPPAIALHLLTPPGTLRPQRVELLIAHLADRLRTG